MIIPVRCFTCGKVLADKWEYYSKRCKEIDDSKDDPTENENYKNVAKKFKRPIFEELGLEKICCRRHLLTHVDLIDIL